MVTGWWAWSRGRSAGEEDHRGHIPATAARTLQVIFCSRVSCKHHQLTVCLCLYVCLAVSQQGDLLHAAADRGVLLAGSARRCHHPPDVDHPGPQITGAHSHTHTQTHTQMQTHTHTKSLLPLSVSPTADVSKVQQKEEEDVTEVQQVEQEGSRGEERTHTHTHTT